MGPHAPARTAELPGKRSGWLAWLSRPRNILLLLLLCNLPALRLVSDVPLAEDADTPGILGDVRRDTSWRGLASWFARDWTGGNKLYRPMVMLSFAADSAVWGDYARGYRFTNWLLCLSVALAVWWWLASLTGSNAFGVLAAVVFSLRQGGLSVLVPGIFLVAAAVAWGVRVLRGRPADRLLSLGAFLAVLNIEWYLNPRSITWIAARTATIGALFCLLSLGCAARFVHTRRPAFAFLAMGLAALAHASYEQSMALPAAAATMVLAIVGARDRERVWASVLLLLPLGAYGLLRLSLFGTELSAHMVVQTRGSVVQQTGEAIRYMVPSCWSAISLWCTSFWCWFGIAPWEDVATILLWCAAFLRLIRRDSSLAAGLFWTKLALFLPMALLNRWDHYRYLPQAADAGLCIALIWPALARERGGAAGEAAEQQPAPGSP